jgi:hypothetical protein
MNNKKHCEVWLGSMSHGNFYVARYGDSEPMVIVHSIDEKLIMDPDDVDEYMVSQGFDSYLIPSEFKGSIVFSTDFMKGLTAK